jgi:3-hydroxybutyryl-CoA dehydrogenase
VTLIDTKKRPAGGETEALSRARREVEANLETLSELGMLERGPSELARDLHIAPTPAAGLGGCTLVFEALPEIVAVKQEFYKAAGAFLDPEAVIASASSTFHLDVFWEVCSRPGNVVCAHWLNPAFLIPLVEVAYGEKTHDWAVARICDFLGLIGKIPVKMRTSPGFIVPGSRPPP